MIMPEYDMSVMSDGDIDMDCYQTFDEDDGDVLDLDLLELEDMSRKPGNSFGQRFKKPFAVEHGHEASSVEYEERKAMEFLKEKMSCDAAFTVDETIRTAIYAFQHLFQKKFEANEIEISACDHDYRVSPKETEYKDAIAKELAMTDIKDHLDFINEPDCEMDGTETIRDGDMDGSKTNYSKVMDPSLTGNHLYLIRDGYMDGSKTIYFKVMDPSLTAELRRDGEKCGAEFLRHEYIYDCSMAPADKAIDFLPEKMKTDCSTVNESTQGFATRIVGVCDSEAMFGVLAVESYVSRPAGEGVAVVETDTNKLVNVFGSVYLIATLLNALGSEKYY